MQPGRCHEQGLTADCPLGRTSGPKCTLVIGPCHNTGVPRCTADCIFGAVSLPPCQGARIHHLPVSVKNGNFRGTSAQNSPRFREMSPRGGQLLLRRRAGFCDHVASQFQGLAALGRGMAEDAG